MNRRQFLTTLAAGAIAAASDGKTRGKNVAAAVRRAQIAPTSKIALIRTRDRTTGVARAIDLLAVNPVRGKKVLLKPNFNTDDPFPASTHNDTLVHLIGKLQKMGAKSITIGERSGPPDTVAVMRNKGIFDLCEKLGAAVVNFEALPQSEWVRFRPEGSHWRNGFLVARPVAESECVVTTCCLKTHGYGGVFTMSLKLSVGVTSKKNMSELHTSFRSMRKMIAEINSAYHPSLVLLDGIDAFTDKGPSHGPLKQANVILAGTDRIAIDAVGLAVLKDLGSNKAIMDTKIFEQEQISRALELGIGVKKPEQIEILSDDEAGKIYADRLTGVLRQG